MQHIRIVGTTPDNRKNYEVLGEHRNNSLLEFTLIGYEIMSAVISTGGGEHRHFPAKQLVQYLQSGAKIHGLVLGDGNKLALDSTMAVRMIERQCNEPNMIYSCCVDKNQALLVGLFVDTYQMRKDNLPTSVSEITGFRFCMMQNIFELTLEETAEWLQHQYVPELSVVSGNVCVNDMSLVNRLYERNARMADGRCYVELVRPDDIVYVRQYVE